MPAESSNPVKSSLIPAKPDTSKFLNMLTISKPESSALVMSA